MNSEGYSFAVIQIDPFGDRMRDAGRIGVLAPVNMDGFYSTEADARELAKYMASERQDLKTFVVRVIGQVRP